MTLKLLINIAKQNFNSLKTIIIPFVIATSFMFALQYVNFSLISNAYIQESETLTQIIIFTSVVTALLTIIFVLYANQNIMRERKQSLALQLAFGVEKKHLRSVIIIESMIQMLIVLLISIVGGFLLGHLTFELLNRIMSDSGIEYVSYHFEVTAMLYTIIAVAFTFILLIVWNNILVTMYHPIKLMNQSKAIEKEPKKWITIVLFVIGLFTLGVAYYMTLTTEGVISAILSVLIAISLMIIATYLLFLSATTLVIGGLKKSDKIYYDKKRFLTISGLRSRLNSNAFNLGSLTVLFAIIVVTLGLTVTIFRGIEQAVESTITQDYVIYSTNQVEETNVLHEEDARIIEEIRERIEVQDLVSYPRFFTSADVNNDEIKPIESLEVLELARFTNVYFQTVDGHNASTGESVTLDANEVAISANADRLFKERRIQVEDEILESKLLDNDYLGNQIYEGMYIVVPDYEMLETLQEEYMTLDTEMFELVEPEFMTMIMFNVATQNAELTEYIEEIIPETHTVVSQEMVRESMYELNGGLIFIGFIVSFIMLVGSILMMYYKQIAEGHHDRRNYQILKQVGVSDDDVKKTIRAQIIWIFTLPFVVALIHIAFSSQIIYNVTGLMNVNDLSLFVTSYIGVAVGMVIVYFVIYLITSRVYYSIVNKEQVE